MSAEQERTRVDLENSPITHLVEYGLALCVSCKTALPLERLARHLSCSHSHISPAARRSIVAEFSALDIVQSIDEIRPCADGSPPLDYLAPPSPGYFCPRCETYKSKDWSSVRKHLNDVHKSYNEPLRREDHGCFLQQWIIRNGPGSGRYWKVDTTIPPSSCGLEGSNRKRGLDIQPSNEDDALQFMEAEEEERLAKEYDERTLALDEELEYDENTDWLRGSGWSDWFAGKSLSLISAAAGIPSADVYKGLNLGVWNGIDCVSDPASEKILRAILVASEGVFTRCEETLAQTPRVLRCWLRSWTFSYFPYPFEAPRRASRQKYKRVWAKLLCYVFRIHSLARRLKETTFDITGLELTVHQKAAMDHIWALISDWLAANEKNYDTGPIQPPDDILEFVFQLFVTFWTQLSENGSTERSVIAHFSGVLGIHPQELAFRRAYDYTPTLSALIWTGRLVILEYALPVRAYNRLAIPWPSRTHYPDQCQRLCDQVRPKYLQRGSMSPIGYLIERLQHGRAIAKRDGARTNISWSPDGRILRISDTNISVQQFRYTVHAVVTRARQQMEDLLFGWFPDVRLENVRDDMACYRPGYSFLAEPSNNLQSSFRALSRRAFSKEGKFALKGSGRGLITKYLHGRDRLVQFLFAAVHLTSGMPARGEELRMIRWANTIATPRNVFVFEGKIILVFAYNKANTNHNNSFYIVRAPCAAVQRILFIYLVYIRPFCDFVSRQAQIVTTPVTNQHVFAKHTSAAGCFSSAACLRSLRHSTPEFPIRLDLRLYRQIAISMSKRHLPALTQHFDPNTPNDHDGFLRFLAFQTGHKPETRVSGYALETAFPARLQPDLIHRYLKSSQAWQEFTRVLEDDLINANVDCNMTGPLHSYRDLGYCPDLPRTPLAALTDDAESGSESETWSKEESLTTATYSQRTSMQGRDCKRKAISQSSKEESKRRKSDHCSLSPTSQRIDQMQRELSKLLEKRREQSS